MNVLRGVLCLVGAMGVCACGVPDEFDQHMEFRDTFVQPGSGGWLGNGLEDPDVSGVDPSYALSSPEGLSSSAGWLLDAASLQTARYMVECALPADRSVTKTVDGETIVLDGLLGLAPEWETDACDQDCQEWVSACLLARTNVSGETVQIFVAGDHEALVAAPPVGTVLEAAFYGNLFEDPAGKYLCRGSLLGAVAARREGRTCSLGQACDFRKYNSCTALSRCTLDEQGVPGNCKTGLFAQSAPYHSIATYVMP